MKLVYAFDEVDEALALMPTAVRRALDVMGRKLSLSSWTALPPDVRLALVHAGASDTVDRDAVERLLAQANPPPIALAPVADPDAQRPPAELVAALEATGRACDADTWSALRPLDRYALVKASRKPEKLARAWDEIGAPRARVLVLYFAGVRDLVGCAEESLSLPARVQTVADLAEHLERARPALAGRLGSVRFARNEEFAAGVDPIAEGDVIALIPPVAGG